MPSGKITIKAAEAGCKQSESNDPEIQCVGPSIKTRLDGNLVVDMFDSFSMKGFFGLQIHGGTSGSVAWRNIRVDEVCEKTGKLGLQMHGGTDCEMLFNDFEVMPTTEDMMNLIEKK